MTIKALIATLFICTAATAEPLLVFAAASLKGPLDAIAGDDVTISYGGSGALARQIEFGAPADAVILANTQWMDVLSDGGHIADETRRTILSNQLVLVSKEFVSIDLTRDGLLKALGNGRLAIGRTTSVPAGIYGRQALMSLGLWNAAVPRLAEVDSVRAALILAERGEVPLALVYASDALLAPSLNVVATLPSASHETIRYDAAQVVGGRDAAAFLARLQDSQPFEEAGFLPPVSN